MDKKLWIGFIVVYIVLALTNTLIHAVMLAPDYKVLADQGLMRGEEAGTIWIYFVTALFTAFFFTLIFSKGYRGNGIGEGVRYGIYVGLFLSVQMAYDSYASWPMPYTIALRWFLATVVQYVILGVIVASVYGKKSGADA